MTSYFPDTRILCENCYKYFVSYTVIHTNIDADSRDDISKNAYTGIINRMRCPHCNSEFTYEIPLFVHSYTDKFAVASMFDDMYINVCSFHTAVEIAGLRDWRFRRAEFTMDNAEKIRIFKSGLDDGKIELLKLRSFPEYADMKLDDEYITFDKSEGEYLFFSHRDFTDRIISEHKVLKSEYSLIKDTNIPCGDWITIDREWAKKFMEDNK